ncbi:DSP domain containing protein [Candidatus Nanopelagicaceae bacterium]
MIGNDSNDPPLYSEIVGNLWQGGTDDEDLVHKGSGRLPTHSDFREFEVVVSLSAYSLPMGWMVKEYRFGFPDGPTSDEIYAELEKIADYAYLDWKAGKKCLVRCQAGINRSGLVVALILMRDGMSAEDAISLIRSKRGKYALENQYFVEYLKSKI